MDRDWWVRKDGSMVASVIGFATLIIAPTIARLAAVIAGEGVQGAHPNVVPMRAGRPAIRRW